MEINHFLRANSGKATRGCRDCFGFCFAPRFAVLSVDGKPGRAGRGAELASDAASRDATRWVPELFGSGGFPLHRQLACCFEDGTEEWTQT